MLEGIKCPNCGGNRFNELGNNTYKCLYCGSTFTHKETENVQSSSAEKSDNVTNLATPPNTTPMSETLRPKSYMAHSVLLGLASILLGLGSIFSIIVLPFAIVSFISAIKVDKLWDKGNIDGAIHASQSAYKYYSIGLRLGIVLLLIAVLYGVIFLCILI